MHVRFHTRVFPVRVVLVAALACGMAARPAAAMLTPAEIADARYEDEIRSLAPTLYAHSPDGMVQLETGVLIVPVSDLEAPFDAGLLSIERVWRSDASQGGRFGAGWRSTLDTSIHPIEAATLPKTALGREKNDGVRGWVFDDDGRLKGWRSRNAQFVLQASAGGVWNLLHRELAAVSLRTDAQGRVTDMSNAGGAKARFAYDITGRLVREERFDGTVREFSYDAAGRMVRLRHADGRTCEVRYDGSGRVVEQTGPGALRTRFSYAGRPGERVTTVTDVLGRKHTYTFAEGGRRVSVRASDGRTFEKRYDAAGRLVAYTGPDGRIRRFEYDLTGRLVRAQGGGGADLELTYDATAAGPVRIRMDGAEVAVEWEPDGMLRAVRDARSGDTLYAYDLRRNVMGVSTPGGVRTFLTYDSAGRLQEANGPADWVEKFTHDPLGRVLTHETPGGGVLRMIYDPAGHLQRVMNPAGGATSWFHDEAGRLTGWTDAAGRSTRLEYDGRGFMAASTLVPGDAVTRYVTDDAGRVTAVTLPGGRTEAYTYDGADRITEQVDALGRRTRYTYDAAGNLVTVEGPDGSRHAYAYDDRGRVVQETPPAGAPREYQYDALGRLVRMVCPGDGLRMTYDDRGQLVRAEFDAAPAISFDYDKAGRVSARRPQGGTAQTFTYDAQGRPAEVRGADGYAESYRYTPAGDLCEVATPWGVTWRFEFDVLGRVIRDVTPGAPRREFEYDGADRLVSEKWSTGFSREYAYDALDHVLRVVENGATWSFAYDAAGLPSAITDPRGGRVQMTYDLGGRLARQVNALGQERQFSWDAADRLTGIRDEAGVAHALEYGPGGRVRRWQAGGETVEEFEYDRAGQPVRTVLNGRALKHAYGPRGERVAVTDEKSGATIRYGYDENLMIRSVSLPGGAEIGYRMDEHGRVAGIDGPGSVDVGIRYDATGRRAGLTLGTGLRARYGYRPDGLVEEVRYERNDGTLIFRIGYTYDAVGRVTAVDHGGRITQYLYDGQGRLKTAQYPGGRVETFTYDACGNMVQAGDTKMEYDAAQRVVRAGSTLYRHDPCGRVVAREGAGGALRLEYDPRGTLRAAVAGDGTRIEYDVDAAGGLLERRQAGTARQFAVDRYDTAVELQGGTVRSVYVNGLAPDERFAAIVGGKPYFYITDLNRNVIALADESGRIVNRYLYTAFGDSLEREEAVPNEYGFQGRWRDPVTGLYHFRQRWYDPVARRFLQPDPAPAQIAMPATMNPYLFAANDPVQVGDPFGAAGSTFDDFMEAANKNFLPQNSTGNYFWNSGGGQTFDPTPPKSQGFGFGKNPNLVATGGQESLDNLRKAGFTRVFDPKSVAPRPGPTTPGVSGPGNHGEWWKQCKPDSSSPVRGPAGSSLPPGAKETYQGMIKSGVPHRAPPGGYKPPAPPAPAPPAAPVPKAPTVPAPATPATAGVKPPAGPPAAGGSGWSTLGKAVRVGGVIYQGYNSYQAISQADNKLAEANKQAGAIIGTSLGGKGGATLGTMIGGPPGGVIGAIVGGWLGGKLGGWLGDPETYKGSTPQLPPAGPPPDPKTMAEIKSRLGEFNRSGLPFDPAPPDVRNGTVNIGGGSFVPGGVLVNPGGDLKTGEATSTTTGSAAAGSTIAAPGVLSGFVGGKQADAKTRGEAGTQIMQGATQIASASTSGDQTLGQAAATVNQAGQQAQATAQQAAATVAQADKASSWGTALGNAIASGIAAGGSAFGSALGGQAAQEAGDKLFGGPTGKKSGGKSSGASGGGGDGDDGGDKTTTSSGATGGAKGAPDGKTGGKKTTGGKDGEGDDGDGDDGDTDGDGDKGTGGSGDSATGGGDGSVASGDGSGSTGGSPSGTSVTVSGSASASGGSAATSGGTSGGSGSGGYAAGPQDKDINGASAVGTRTVTGVKVTINYEAYDIPDTFQIVYEGNVIANTGSISGSGTFTASGQGTSSSVTIRVISSSNQGTQWTWSGSVEFFVK